MIVAVSVLQVLAGVAAVCALAALLYMGGSWLSENVSNRSDLAAGREILNKAAEHKRQTEPRRTTQQEAAELEDNRALGALQPRGLQGVGRFHAHRRRHRHRAGG